MFTVFLALTAAAVCTLLTGLLLRPGRDAAPLRLPVQGLLVAVLATALAGLGLWVL